MIMFMTVAFLLHHKTSRTFGKNVMMSRQLDENDAVSVHKLLSERPHDVGILPRIYSKPTTADNSPDD